MKKPLMLAIILVAIMSSQAEAEFWRRRDAHHGPVYFFPAGKARMDGSKVTVKSWLDLPTFQKAMFIFEYEEELSKKYGTTVEVDEWECWAALNDYAEKNKASTETIANVMEGFLVERYKTRRRAGPFYEGPSTDYSYADGDHPVVCFFPLEQARWDGSKVTVEIWRNLTRYQKIMFITEYVKELERKYSATVDINEWKYWIVLDGFARDTTKLDAPMAKVLEAFLIKSDKIKIDGNKK